MKTIAEKIISFNSCLNLKLNRTDIEVMNPFLNHETRTISETFYRKYYNDSNSRTLIFGINPGRHGAGVTGVPFTDPIKLESECGIENNFKKLPELSSQFIYKMINEFGGVESFYNQFYITAVVPLGFKKDEKNFNYYDDKLLWKEVKPFAIQCIQLQLEFGVNSKAAFCLGEGENFKHLKIINDEFQFFKKIIPLPHPRWIMQYRRKQMNELVSAYLKALNIQN